MTAPICRRLGRAGLGDRGLHQLGQLASSELGRQVAVQHRAFGPLPVGQLGPPGGVERLGRLAALLRLPGEHL